MATKKQRARVSKRRRHEISPDDLHPSLRAGLTQGATAEEAQQELGPVANKDAGDIVAYMRDQEAVAGTRVPIPRFVGQNASTGFVRESLDRRMGDAMLTFPRETIRAIQSGMICLRCLEPQPGAFADEHLEGCEGVLLHGPSYMKDRQVVDFALEFEGENHIGPSRPMSEFAEEQDARVEKRRFVKRVADGGQGRIPKEWLADATLFEGLAPSEVKELVKAAR